MGRARQVLTVLVGLALVLAVAPTAGQARSKPRLKSFSDCGQLVRYAKRHRQNYRAGGPPPGMQPMMPPPMGAPGAPGAPGGAEGGGNAPTAAPAPVSDSSGGFSLTNNQESGVFEPDIVKTDGQTVYAMAGGVLHVVDVRSGTPVEIGSVPIGEGYGHQMLLYEGKLLIFWADYRTSATTLALVDVADGTKPIVLRTLGVTGDVLAARRTSSTVRIVLAVRPRAIVQPARADTASPRAWLPTGRFKNVRRNTAPRTRRLVACKAVRRPRAFSGLEQLTVLTIDFDRGLDPVDADALMTSGDTVYASAENLFVATRRYAPAIDQETSGPPPEGETTQIHRFSLDDASNTTYRGSGQVPGFLLNQFSLSEQGDVLRVASTDVPPWFGGNQEQSQSFVTTLSEKADRLDRLGQVGGIGKGERIFAVRFLGDIGYVVTFEQTDPLFTIDLADPAKPVVRGELVIPGFSEYLHPIGGDRLIGVGYGPSDDQREFGLQISEFDVSDVANPKLEQRTTIDGGSSSIGYDHHAFLWWAPRELAVLPVQIYRYSGPRPGAPPPQGAPSSQAAPEQQDSFVGAIGFTVRPAAIAEAGRITHGDALVTRSLVIGDGLYTLSESGLKASALDGFADRGFARFAASGNAPQPSPGNASSPAG